jgi:hypothetical protein
MKFLLPALASAANPIGQVLDLLQKLYNTVVEDGEVEQKQFETFAEWCEDQAKERQFEIKTGSSQAESLRAVISKSSADIDAANSRIAELSTVTAANQKDLTSATELRKKENDSFRANEKELVETVDTLRRAQSVLSRQLKGGSFAQLPQAIKDLTSTLSVIMDASTIFSTSDRNKLKSFLQAGEEGVNAPEAAAYESHSSGILDTLADMQDKAEGLLSEARKTEVNSRHAFELLAQSINDELKVQNDSLSRTKKQRGATAEVKGQAEGDLAKTTKDLEEDQTYVKELAQNCQQRALDHEISLKSRQEELNALREGRRVIAEATGGAASRQYKSFVQEKSTTHSDAFTKIEKEIKNLGRKDNSAMLVQLAGQIRATVAMNNDPFGKVKDLIQGMISPLLVQAQEEASHKEFCDKETKENEAKRNKLQAENQKLSTRIERAEAGIAGLKQQISELNATLADTAKSQKEMDAMRKAEHEEFVKAEADFKQGISGVRTGLKVLREYYQQKGGALVQEPTTSVHSASSDSGNGIISILEVAESDFARSLAEAQAGEDDAVEVYEKTTQENKISTATKRTSVEGKGQEVDRLSQLISDAQSDRAGVEEELSAVMEYLDKLRPQCTTEPMSYEERKARREHEIEGLKSALNILENETALVQTPHKSFLASRQ